MLFSLLIYFLSIMAYVEMSLFSKSGRAEESVDSLSSLTVFLFIINQKVIIRLKQMLKSTWIKSIFSLNFH